MSQSIARVMASDPRVVLDRSETLASAGKGRNAHHRSVTRALSPHAELSGPAADHPRHLEDARGGVVGNRQRAWQQRDVLLHAGSRRHAHRCAAPFRRKRACRSTNIRSRTASCRASASTCAISRRAPKSRRPTSRRRSTKAGVPIPKKGTVLLCTGHHARTFPTAAYTTDNPGVNVAATEWLARQGIVHFGIDSMRPGPEGMVNTLVHKACLELDITHIESLCNLESAARRRASSASSACRSNGAAAPARRSGRWRCSISELAATTQARDRALPPSG